MQFCCINCVYPLVSVCLSYFSWSEMLVKKIVYVLNLVEKILRREMHNKRATNELQISQDKFLLSLEGHDEGWWTLDTVINWSFCRHSWWNQKPLLNHVYCHWRDLNCGRSGRYPLTSIHARFMKESSNTEFNDQAAFDVSQ